MRLSTVITRLVDRFYFPFIAKIVSIRTFRYGVCGVFNFFVLDPILYFLIFHFIIRDRWIDLCWIVITPHIVTYILVFPIIIFTGFWLNKYVAFRNSPVRTPVQMLRYLMSVGVALLLGYVSMKLFVEVMFIYPTPSKILTNCVTVVSSYLIQRYYTFRGSTE